ncbi:MAG TPA: SWIM zinc finger family protein [Thermoleophilaceae bacterium]|nr:SWIM zinc finger family protein [Thermoleophilaceae bacterium]
MTNWTPQQVLALAPDPSAAKAGQGLASPRPWSELGQDERAVWGLCQGSGKKPYQTQVDLSEPVFKCTCPSRKFPCKHALGLLLLWSSSDAVPTGTRPAWVEEWLASREQRAERAAERAERAAKPPDPQAQARRAARREERVARGAEELRRWLTDLVRRGLAEAQREPWRFWDEAAARMVDAQATGLASRVRRMSSAVASGDDWAGRLLEDAALLQLLLEAYERLDTLPAGVQADVRQLVGWTVASEEVLAGEHVRDEWAVVGQVVVEDDRLRSQRTWLRGHTSGRDALILAFAAAGQVVDPGVVFGTTIDASLAFYPGAAQLRALVAERHDAPRPLERLPGYQTAQAVLASRATALASNPWLDRFPVGLCAVVPARDDDGWALVDEDGGALRLARRHDWWPLVSLSGGHRIDVFGELERDELTPLAAAANGRTVLLA